MKTTTLSTSLAALLLLAACGGSSSSSPGGGGGGGGGQITRGAITAQSAGKITVNGVALDVSGAAVSVEKSAASASALKLGMVVTVKGSFDDRTGEAAEVEFEDTLTGRVDDKGTDFLVVAGQTVRVDDTTHFEDNVARLGGIDDGDRVRVSGVPDDRGGLRASRIDSPDDSSNDLEVKGYVSDLTETGFALSLTPGAAPVFTVTLGSGVTLPAGLQNGSFVEVHAGMPAAGTTAIVATRVHLEDRFGSEAPEIEVEGIVVSGDATEFVVDGMVVRPLAGARWVYGVPGDLIPGVKVEAEGHALAEDGALLADKISFRAAIRLQAPVKNLVLDGQHGTFTMMGIPVSISDLTDWRMDVALTEDTIVELRGMPGRDGLSVVATRIEDRNDDRLILQGVVTAKDDAAGSVTILGLTGASDGGTEYHEHDSEVHIGRAAFFAQVTAGETVVKVRGRDASALSGTVLTAEEMELEDHE